MAGAGTLIGTPIGILAGHLPRRVRPARLARPAATRFINDVLLSAAVDRDRLFVYAVYVAQGEGTSRAGPGAVALAIIVVPVVVRTDRRHAEAGAQQPARGRHRAGLPELEDGHLGLPTAPARAGIVTGILLAIARIAGETAPLLFTSLNNQFWSSDMNRPMANLPVVIFQFAMSPYDDWHRLAWGGAALITLLVLGINIAARALFSRK
jgi:phosphate transport system permease protein